MLLRSFIAFIFFFLKYIHLRILVRKFRFLGFFFKDLFLFIYLFILAATGLSCGRQDLHCSMQDPFLVAACGLVSCGMRTESSSPARDRTQAPCIGSAESYPLDHQGSPVES